MGQIYYPPANRDVQWYGPGNAIVSPNKILWHTTEGLGWPSYSGGSVAPNLTYDPWAHEWRQHFQLNGTARALANGADGYSTNRKGVCQIEIIATNGWNATIVQQGKAIWNLDNQALDDLAAFSEFMNKEWGVSLSTGVDWPKYPAAPKRLTRAEYEAYRGHMGHMHAPDNDHGDPGSLNIQHVVGGVVNMTDVNIVSMNESVYERIAWWVIWNYKLPMMQPHGVGEQASRRSNDTTLGERLAWNEEYTFRAANEAAAKVLQSLASVKNDIVQAIVNDPDVNVDPAVVEAAVAKAFTGLTVSTTLETTTPVPEGPPSA